MTSNSVKAYQLGQSIWYDNIQRKLLRNGELEGMIQRGEIYGVTSNPSIFNNAIAKSNDYDDELLPLARQGKSAFEIFEALAVEDIRAATDLFSDLYKKTNGGDGYVSLEVNPDLAHDTEQTCSEAKRLWELVNRPNLMIKIPATQAGIPAIQRSIAAGINVNVTLIFSQARYEKVMLAYLTGLEERLANGKPIDSIASVASFFVSRLDTNVDQRLEALVNSGKEKKQIESLFGKAAVANAKLAYQRYKLYFETERFEKLHSLGAKVQRPLWASTSTKNPAYYDLLYVDTLIGPDTVNTIPPQTLVAFNEHGKVALTLEEDVAEAENTLSALESLGISMAVVTKQLEDEGVASFSQAFRDLLIAIEGRK